MILNNKTTETTWLVFDRSHNLLTRWAQTGISELCHRCRDWGMARLELKLHVCEPELGFFPVECPERASVLQPLLGPPVQVPRPVRVSLTFLIRRFSRQPF